MAIRIIGTGSYLPKKVADNHFLSTIVDTDDEWIDPSENGNQGKTFIQWKRRNHLYGYSCCGGGSGECRYHSR